MLWTARGLRAALGLASALAFLSACTGESGSGAGSRSSPAAARTSSPPPIEPTPTIGEPTPTIDPGLLLADLTVLRATSVQIEPLPRGRLLRFGTRLANVGGAPIEVTPAPRRPCPRGQRAFVQQIARDANGDGVYDRRVDTGRTSRAGACALFHPTHEHWHIDGSARYELQDTEGSTIAARRKVSFCLRDTHGVPGSVGPRRMVYQECSRDAPQGISAGWSDLYDFDLDGQAMRLPPDLPNGTYCLVMTADPFDLLLESDETNNASVTPVAIRGATATRVPGSSPCRPQATR